MTVRAPCLAAICLLALACTPAVATEPGNMMKVTTTTKMSMPGMTMPPVTRTVEVCTSARKPDVAQMMQNRKDCQVSNIVKDGNTTRYRIHCQGQMTMQGDGSFRHGDDGSMHGTMHATGTTSGQTMTIDITYDGVRTGACDYNPPAAAAAAGGHD